MCRHHVQGVLVREVGQLVSMINADLVAISHVIGSLQLARIFHEAVTFSPLAKRLLGTCGVS